MTEKKHTPGTIRAAEEIEMTPGEMYAPEMAEIIDRETHAAEMEAFIREIAERRHTFLCDVVDEARELLKKVRD